MQDIHVVLNDAREKCTKLTEEIKKFRDTRELNQKTVESLDAVCAALIQTARNIKPITEARLKRYFYLIGALSLLNTILFAVILYLMLSPK